MRSSCTGLKGIPILRAVSAADLGRSQTSIIALISTARSLTLLPFSDCTLGMDPAADSLGSRFSFVVFQSIACCGARRIRFRAGGRGILERAAILQTRNPRKMIGPDYTGVLLNQFPTCADGSRFPPLGFGCCCFFRAAVQELKL